MGLFQSIGALFRKEPSRTRTLAQAIASLTDQEWDRAVALIRAQERYRQRLQGVTNDETWKGIRSRAIGVRLRWSPADRERILAMCEGGDFYALGLFLDSMRANGPVYGAMRARGALLRLPIQWTGDPWLIEWLRGSDPVYDPQTGALLSAGHRSDYQRLFPLSELGAVLWDGDLAGLGVGEFVPDRKGRKRLRHLDLHWLRFDWTTRDLVYQSPWDAYVVRPGDGRWFVHAPYGLERWWARAPWLACALPVIAMEAAVLDRCRWQRDLADPLKTITHHKDRLDDEIEELRRFAEEDWHRAAYLILQENEKADLVESTGRGYEVYTQSEKSSADTIALTLRGQIATSGGAPSGIANTGSVWENVEQGIVAESAEQLAETVQEQGLAPYAVEKRRAPLVWLRWDCRTPAQKIADAEAMAKHADGISKMNTAAAPYGKRVSLEAQIESGGLSVELEDLPTRKGAGVQLPMAPPAGSQTTAELNLPQQREEPSATAAAASGPDRRIVCGLPVIVDRPAGTTQTGIGPDGPWTRTYLVDYGYLEGTVAPDGDGIDVYIGGGDGPLAWIVEQRRHDGSFDEPKVMLGFEDAEAAVTCYLEHAPLWAFGPVREVAVGDLIEWVRRYRRT